jgi:hypothetical protein
MNTNSIVVIGLPSSGKTTYLAALWHLLTERSVDTVLKFHSLGSDDKTRLNALAARWRDAVEQDRTAIDGMHLVSMNLKDAKGNQIKLSFPDVPGESFWRMWEERTCDVDFGHVLLSGQYLLFVHSDDYEAPSWTVDEVALSRKMGLPTTEGKPVPWHPRLAPTQVQLVGLLQLLKRAPLASPNNRIAVVLSAWDKGQQVGLSPEAFLKSNLPLLSQYLDAGFDGWDFRVYGLSAQGGDYDKAKDPQKPTPESNAEARALRELDEASSRIKLVGGGADVRDITEPLAWLTR